VVLNLVSTTDEQTDAIIGLVTDGGFHVGTMVFGPKDLEREVRSQRVFVRSDVAHRRQLTEAAAVHAESDAGRLHGKTILVPPTNRTRRQPRCRRALAAFMARRQRGCRRNRGGRVPRPMTRTPESAINLVGQKATHGHCRCDRVA